jgi:hypothetical protein
MDSVGPFICQSFPLIDDGDEGSNGNRDPLKAAEDSAAARYNERFTEFLIKLPRFAEMSPAVDHFVSQMNRVRRLSAAENYGAGAKTSEQTHNLIVHL